MKYWTRTFNLKIGNPDDTLNITSLRFTFKIKRSYRPKPDESVFEIYNISPATRELLSTVLTYNGPNELPVYKFNNISLELGYGELKEVFRGEIFSITHEPRGPDIITKIISNDGLTDYAKSKIAITLAAGATDRDVIYECLAAMPNTELGSVDVMVEKPLPRASTLFGRCRKVLGTANINQGRTWSIRNGRYIAIADDSAEQTEVYLLSLHSGMIDAPKRGSDGGVEVQCLANPNITLNTQIAIESITDATFNGQYKVLEMEFVGDTHGSDWTQKLTVANGRFVYREKEIPKGKKDKGGSDAV